MDDATHKGGSKGGNKVARADSVPPALGWSADPSALLALAIVLEQFIGPGEVLDDPGIDSAWYARHDRAAEILAELANTDSELLSLVIGPPAEASSPGRALLTLAALKIEQPR